MQEDAGECWIFRYALRKFRKDCENFATIAKISLCTVFRYHSEIRYHSENYCA